MKKEYKKPYVISIATNMSEILAGSTGATGEDVPWAAKRKIDSYEEEPEWEEEEDY